ncbi:MULTISPECIES: hypothetical protein [Helcococcus]|uniref:Uncharacterized protein n=1 Tax=Helcococcus bovis TaxID=3153252 RepID=A0ABW9F817_9FIRM
MDTIKIELPSNPIYTQLLRLSSASLANKVGFDVDKVADLQQVVSEIFTLIIPSNEKIDISFKLGESYIQVDFENLKFVKEDNQNDAIFEIKKQIILYLSDQLVIEDDKIVVVLNK